MYTIGVLRIREIILLAAIICILSFPVYAKYSGGGGTPEDPYKIATAEDLNDIGNHQEDLVKHFVLVNDIDLSECAGTQFTLVEVKGISSVSGLVGLNEGTIVGCWTAGSIAFGDRLGGLVGENGGILSDSYAWAEVLAGHDAGGSGGLAGDNSGTVVHCYAAGQVAGPEGLVGGLVGQDLAGAVTGSFWDIQISGETASAGGKGKTTSEMQSRDTFLVGGWDFVREAVNGLSDVWTMPVEGGYPIFAWQQPYTGPVAIAYWPFDETSGTLAMDSAGASPGTVNGAQWTDGKIGGALSFDGVDNSVNCGRAPELAPDLFTLAFWCNPEKETFYTRSLITKAANTGYQVDYRVDITASGRIVLRFSDQSSHSFMLMSDTKLPNDEWNQVAVMRSESQGIIYLNGAFDSNQDYTFVPISGGYDLLIGRGVTTTTQPFKGKIDEVKLFNVPLCEEKIQGF